MWTIFKVSIQFVTILLLFYVLVIWPRGMWDLSSLKSEVKVKVAQLCPTLRPHRLYSPWNSLGQNIKVGSLSFLQGIFPTQGSNPGLLHCRWIL